MNGKIPDFKQQQEKKVFLKFISFFDIKQKRNTGI